MSHKPTDPDPGAIGARVRAERIRLGLTVSEAARRLNSSRQNYQQWEAGEFLPGLSTLIVLKGLGMDLRTIVPELFD